MSLVNHILLETMDKIVEMREPKPTTQYVFQNGKFVPCSIYKYHKEEKSE